MSDPLRLFERILSSDIKADLLLLFHRDSKLVDSPDGLARRIGRKSTEIDGDLRDLEEVGLLSRESSSGSSVFRYDERRAGEIQRIMVRYVTESLESE